jgi:hypothetical protein
MSQLHDLVRILVAAGNATHPKGKGIYLLLVDNKTCSLTSNLWTGSDFSARELITESVRPNSLASYLITPTVETIIYISSSSSLNVIRYSDDDGDWIIDDSVAQHEVHRDGKLAALVGADGHPRVFFQDPSKRLIYLDNSWIPKVLPADPVNGSPLSTLAVGGQVHLFYVSASDNCLHYATQQQDGSWTDTSLPKFTFEVKLRRLLVVQDESGAFEAFALTEGDELVLVTAAEHETLGALDEMGKLVLSSSAENTRRLNCGSCSSPRCPLFGYATLRVVS